MASRESGAATGLVVPDFSCEGSCAEFPVAAPLCGLPPATLYRASGARARRSRASIALGLPAPRHAHNERTRDDGHRQRRRQLEHLAVDGSTKDVRNRHGFFDSRPAATLASQPESTSTNEFRDPPPHSDAFVGSLAQRAETQRDIQDERQHGGDNQERDESVSDSGGHVAEQASKEQRSGGASEDSEKDRDPNPDKRLSGRQHGAYESCDDG